VTTPTATPDPTGLTLADLTAVVSYLADGAQVNMDDLYKEVAPGVTPKLTLMRLANLLAMLGKFSPSLGQTTIVEPSLLMEYSHSPPYPIVPGSAGSIASAGDSIMQMLTKLQHGTKLTSVAFWTKPDSHASLPQFMPNFRVYRQTLGGGTASVIAALVTDPSANTTAYDAAHPINCPITAGNGPGGTSEIVDLTQYVYYGAYISESGTNSDTAAALYGCVMTVAYV
jgi:hypothetical protein